MQKVSPAVPVRTCRTPITYYGGKQRMIPHILPLIPQHKLYAEPFFGGGAIFFAKEPSVCEWVNDLNGEVANFYEQCKSNFDALQKMIISTDCYSRIYHRRAGIIYDNPECFTPVERAWAFWIQTNFSFSAKIKGGWSYELQDGSCARRFVTKKNAFDEIIRCRLANVYVENKPALDLIKSLDAETTFFYIDPPYPGSNQGHYAGYSITDFVDLLNLLTTIKGKFLLSSYPLPILTEYTHKWKWHQKEISQQLSAVNGKTRSGRKKIECLTMNYTVVEK